MAKFHKNHNLANFPNSMTEIIHNGRHFPYIEAPEAFFSTVDNFISKL